MGMTTQESANILRGVVVAGVALTVFLVFGVLACDTEPATGPGSSDPYALWRSYGLRDYTIDQTRSCFCPDAGVTVRVTVRSDTIASIVRVSDNMPVTTGYYVTVDSLFGIIRSPEPDSLIVRYNATYGYPEHLDVDPQLHPVDGGYLFETSNLRTP